MAKFIRHLIPIAAIFLTRAVAQQLPPGMVSVEFSVYAFNDEPARVRYAVAKTVSPELHFYPTARSEPYRYEGPAHLVFFRRAATPVAARQPVAEIQLKPEIKKPLLVFFPLKRPTAAGLEFSVVEFDDSLANLPAGHLVIFNATSYELALTVGHNSITLEPGPSAAIEMKHATKILGALVIGGTKYPGAIEDILPGTPDERGLLFLYPPLRRGSPVLQYAHLVEPVGRPPREGKQR